MSSIISPFNRRTFVAGVGALFATSAFARSKPKGGGQPEKLDAIVVGAGLAGLNAAHILEGQGLKVAVIEANDRVGGRLRTGRAEGYSGELGGSEVGALYGRVRNACAQFNVGLVEQTGKAQPFMLDIGGQTILPKDWASSSANLTIGKEREILPFTIQNKLFFDWVPFEDPADWLEPKYYEHDISAAEYMRSRGVSEAAIKLANVDINGPSLEAVSAMSIFRDLARIKVEGFRDPTKPQYGAGAASANKSHAIEGGSDMLPKAMAAALKGRVMLNSPVAAINQAADDVEVLLRDGSRLRSRFVVMAAPFSAVKNMVFNPGLPSAQANAVQGALYSATTQFHFRVLKPFWEQDGLPPSIWTDRYFERAFVLSGRGGHFGTMTVWLNGDGATRLNAMDLPTQRAFVLNELAECRPSTKGVLEFLCEYSWEKNPFVGGNKHCFGAGQVKAFAKDMALPHGRVHFAGEHLRRMEPGMESAMETSEIAALELLERS
jgi:monoamine oxidase